MKERGGAKMEENKDREIRRKRQRETEYAVKRLFDSMNFTRGK